MVPAMSQAGARAEADFTATVNCYGGGGTGGVLKDSAFDLLFVVW
jgi:hypothetical protein